MRDLKQELDKHLQSARDSFDLYIDELVLRGLRDSSVVIETTTPSDPSKWPDEIVINDSIMTELLRSGDCKLSLKHFFDCMESIEFQIVLKRKVGIES